MKNLIVFLSMIWSAVPLCSQNLPMVVGLEGPGVRWSHPFPNTFTVVHVQNTNASGPNSLAAALAGGGNKVIVFDVSGVIDRRGMDVLKTTGAYTVIAGQTAPSPGITVIGCEFRILHPNVLVQHVRFRPGDALRNLDPPNEQENERCGIQVLASAVAVNQVIVDHCSFSYGTDENLSVYRSAGNGAENITFSNNISGHGLYNSVHSEAPHSMGMHAGTTGGGNLDSIAFLNNLILSSNERAPQSQAINFYCANNYIYNMVVSGIRLVNEGEPTLFATFSSLVGNVFDRGPNTLAGMRPILITSSFHEDSRVYIADTANSPGFTRLLYNLADEDNITSDPLWTPSGVTPNPSGMVREWVRRRAGARPNDRDVVDAQFILDTYDATGSIIDCVAPGTIYFPSGEVVSATSTTVVFGEPASNVDDRYESMTVEITSGPGAGQTRTISSYQGATRTATVPAWNTEPTSDSEYRIWVSCTRNAGGWPTLPVNARTVQEIDNPNTYGADGYANWEKYYLHWFADQVERPLQIYKAQVIN